MLGASSHIFTDSERVTSSAESQRSPWEKVPLYGMRDAAKSLLRVCQTGVEEFNDSKYSGKFFEPIFDHST